MAKSWTFTEGTVACLSDTIAVRGVGPHSASEAGDRNVRIPEHRKESPQVRVGSGLLVLPQTLPRCCRALEGEGAGSFSGPLFQSQALSAEGWGWYSHEGGWPGQSSSLYQGTECL